MPLYEYQCDACGQRFEVIQKFSDAPPEVCAKCGKGPVTRLLSSPAIQFKGTGWYITDYAQKGKSGGDGKATDAKKDSASEGKSDGKTESKSDSSSSDTSSKTADSSAKSAATKTAKD
jgi:putative FmdB family regulatory protein